MASPKDVTDPQEIADAITAELGPMAEVMMPGECDEPILAKPVREAVYQWMIEHRHERQLQQVGLQPRLSCLLYGPPGCGKTTLAHHFAARMGMPLVVLKGEELIESYIGSTGRNIGHAFRTLRKWRGKAIGLLDEIDAIASKRGDGGRSADKERNSIVAAMLTNIEGLKTTFFAATNLHELIDPAVWRRFSIQIDVALPEFEERYAIIRRYSEPYAFDETLIDALALATNGAAPSLLRQLVEGIKRHLVLYPALRKDVNQCSHMIEEVVSAVAPHPSYLQPPFVVPQLWRSDGFDFDQAFGAAPWPPELKKKGEQP